jgi:hypothetical protein
MEAARASFIANKRRLCLNAFQGLAFSISAANILRSATQVQGTAPSKQLQPGVQIQWLNL